MRVVFACLIATLASEKLAHAGEWTKTSPSVMHFQGAIVEGEFDRFIEKFDDGVDTIVVDSPGGLITEGLRIGQFLLAKKVTVDVQGICMSSCANYLFLAGKRRVISRGIVGYHGNHTAFMKTVNATVDGLPKELALQIWSASYGLPASATEAEILAEIEKSKVTVAAEGKFFAELGISQDLFDRAERPDKGMGNGKEYAMLLPTHKTFEKYGVLGVEGDQSQDVISTDPRVVAAAKAGMILIVD
ncbi:MAG: hypothetical protein ACXVB9_19615 [Bdellovibrionota bacterium]